MAHFVDFGETADIFRPSLKTIFNGFNLDDELTDENGSFMTLSVSGRNDSEYDITTHDVPGLDGVIEEGNPTLNPRIISVRFRIKADTSTHLQRKFEKLRSLLEGSKKELAFTDDEFFFYATNQALEIPDETSNSLTSVITFLCSDPYKYSPEKTVIFPSDLVVVNNEGTAEAFPIYEMTVTAPITFAMIQNHLEESMLIGEPADDDVQIVDTRTSVLYENGSTLNEWSATTNIEFLNNDNNIDSLNGVMGTDAAGIRPDSYGTAKNKQRGPAIYKELSEPIQDFEMETTFDILSNREIENFRMMIYFNDENMNPIGQIGIKDNSRNYKRRRPIAQVGRHNQHVLLGDSSKTIDNARNTTLFYFRMKREGQRFTFYVGEWQGQKHINTWEESFNDINNEFQGELKFITLFIGSYQDRVTPSRLRMNSVEIFELTTIQDDQTPYIAYPGDIITIDTQSEEMLINGEDAMTEKAFITDFFTLKKGENTLAVLPEDSLEVEMRYRERRK